MGSGAWSFLVGGLPCQVDSGNERDLFMLIYNTCLFLFYILEGLLLFKTMEVGGNNMSVMPFDVLGCTRATLMYLMRLSCMKSLGKP